MQIYHVECFHIKSLCEKKCWKYNPFFVLNYGGEKNNDIFISNNKHNQIVIIY